MSTVAAEAFAKILHTKDLRDFARIEQQIHAATAELHSIDPADYEEARRTVLEAIGG